MSGSLVPAAEAGLARVRWSHGDPALQRALAGALATGAVTGITDNARRRTLRLAAGGGLVFLKQFRVGSGRHPRREALKARIGRAPAEREWRALAALHAAGLPVPEPLALGALPDGDRLLAMAWIEGVPFETALLAAAPRARRALLGALGALLARFHEAGWIHADLHPGNFLVRAGTPVVLDWQHARRTRSASARARDLARLEHGLAPLVPLAERVHLRAAALGLVRPLDAPARAALRAAGAAADRRAEQFVRGRTRRLLRPGRAVARVRSDGLRGLRLRTLEAGTLEGLLAAHAEALSAADARVLKDDHRARVTGHVVGGRALVVKEAPWRGLGRALADALRGSAARRAWRAGHGIALRRIGVARPEAWLERRRAGVPVRSWVVLEDVRPGVPSAFALEHGLDADAVLDALTSLLVALHRCGVDHGDLQGTHVYLRRGPRGLETRLIDLEAVRFRRPLPDACRVQALAELHASLPDAFPNDARLRAWRRYARALPFTGGAGPALARVVRASLARRHRWSGCDPAPGDDRASSRSARPPASGIGYSPASTESHWKELEEPGTRPPCPVLKRTFAPASQLARISRKASILRVGSSGFRPWNTISTRGRTASTFTTSVASVKSLPMPSTASIEKRGTGTSEMSKVYSRRIWRAGSPGGLGVSSGRRPLLDEEATCRVVADRDQRGLLVPAACEDERAARVEATTARRVSRRGDVPGQQRAARNAR